MSRALPALLAVAYLTAAQVAGLQQNADAALLAGLLLSTLLLLPALLRGQWLAWCSWLLLAAGLWWLRQRALGLLPLLALPVLLNLFLAWLFGHTLAGMRMPLIERVIRAMGSHPQPLAGAIIDYARLLTLSWTLFFIAMALLNLLLALLVVPGGLLLAFGVEPPLTIAQQHWSLFANGLNYLLVGLFFVVEFALRRRRFGQLPYRNLGDFCRQLARLGPGFWRNPSR